MDAKLTQSGQIILSDKGDTFTFTLNADGETWKVMGTNSQYWDGVADGFTGWHTYGHPYKFYEYYVQPYFTVTVEFVNAEGTAVAPAQAKLVKAGESVTLVLPEVNEFVIKSCANIEKATTTLYSTLNVYEVLNNREYFISICSILIVASIIGAALNVIPYFFFDFTETKQKSTISVLKIRALFEDYANGVAVVRGI